MDAMDLLLEMLRYLLPSALCLTAAYLIIVRFLNNEDRRRKGEIILENKKVITPMRMQSYERIVLMLERISPENLIMRVSKSNMDAGQLQQTLVKNIRSEFEHNISQQVYVSINAWHLVKSAKEETIKIINVAFAKVGPKAPGIELTKEIFNQLNELDITPSLTALNSIKKEVNRNFF